MSDMTLNKILNDIVGLGLSARLSGGLGLRYTLGLDSPDILSLSRIGVYPSDTEIDVVLKELSNVLKPHTTAESERLQKGNWHIVRINVTFKKEKKDG